MLAEPHDPRLPLKVDRVLIVHTCHDIDGRERYFRKLLGYLRAGGEVAIIDFTKESPIGPPVSARIAPQQVGEEMRRAGYELATSHTFLPHQDFLVFRPR